MDNLTKKQIETIEGAGFKVGNDGKVREGGRLIGAAEVAQIIAGNIIANVSFEDMKKKRARKVASGGKTLAEKLDEISPAIGLLRVGKTARIAIPKTAEAGKDPVRSFVMSVTTKLNHITAAGREWAGRRFDTMSDDSKEFLYVARLDDTDSPVVRKAGGRRKAGETSSNANTNLDNALARSREHLAGQTEQQQTEKQVDAVMSGGVAESSAEGPATVEPEQVEDAVLIQS